MAIAFVQSGQATHVSNNATLSVGLVATTVGDDILFFVSPESGGGVTSVTDNGAGGGNTYTFLTSLTNGTVQLEVWLSHNTTVSTTSVTAHFSPQCPSEGICAEYSGVSAIGGHTTNIGSDTNPTISLNLQDASNWLVTGFDAVMASPSYTQQTGTLRTTSSAGLNNNAALVDNGPTSGSTTCSVTYAVASNWAGAAVELRSATTVEVDQPSDAVLRGKTTKLQRTPGPGQFLGDNVDFTPPPGPGGGVGGSVRRTKWR